MGGEKAEHENGRKITDGRDLKFMIRVVILLGSGFVSVSSAEERQPGAGRAAIAFHWQADKQGPAWRQEGHYQRLGQTQIRASFGPLRQAGRQAGTHALTHARTHTHRPWKLQWKDCKARCDRVCQL